MTKQPTGRGLLIAEKSSAMIDIQATYNKHRSELPYTLDFEKFHGHVTRLKMPGDIKPEWAKWDLKNLPMIPKKWEYIPEENPKRYNAVMDALKKGNYDFIINAGDYEREGQLIQDAFFSTMPANLQTLPIYRLWSNDMSDAKILDGLKNLLLPDDNIPNAGKVKHLSEASFIRARFDWLLGLNSTQLLSLKSNSTIKSGRVKLPVLKIIVDRELGITKFVPKAFWTIRGVFQHKNGTYEGYLLDENGKTKQFDSEKSALAVVESLDGGASITSLSISKAKEKAPKFYSVAPLQGDAAEVYGITMPESLAALQYLYEQKILSYPRTDSQYITTDLANDISDVYKAAKNVPVLGNFANPTDDSIKSFQGNKYYVNNKEARAHTALMPIPNSNFDYSRLTDIQQKVLYLVARSVILSFMNPVLKEKTEIITSIGEMNFKTNGSRILDAGWSAAVPEYSSPDQILPEVSEGDSVDIDSTENKKGSTTPPKRYTVKTLMSLLENIHRLLEDDDEKLAMKTAEGLGRPATRTSILEDMMTGNLIFTKGKKQEYHATEFGVSIIESLGDTPLVSPSLTAAWESKLQAVESGDMDSNTLYNEMVTYTKYVMDSLDSVTLNIRGAVSNGHDPVAKLKSGNDVFESKAGFYDSEFKSYMNKVEEARNSGDTPPEFFGFWLAKTIDNSSLKMKGSFSKKDLITLISGDSIVKNITWHKNKTNSDTKMIFDENNKLKFVFENSQEHKELNLSGHKVDFVTGTKSGKDYAFYKVDNDDDFIIWQTIAGTKLTEDDINTLLSGNKVSGTFTDRKGKPFDAKLVLDGKKTIFEFDNTGSGAKSRVIFDDSGVKVEEISGEKSTGKFLFYKLNDSVTVSSVIAKHKMTESELITLAKTGKVVILDFVSKKNKPFQATLTIVGDKTEFVFD